MLIYSYSDSAHSNNASLFSFFRDLLKQTTASDSQEPLRESDSQHKLDEETSALFWWSLEKGNGSTGASLVRQGKVGAMEGISK